MNKKQPTRTLGTIETKQSTQPKQATQATQAIPLAVGGDREHRPLTKKELNKDLQIESEEDDDNIEASSMIEHNSAYSRGVKGAEPPEVKPRKKRVISEEQKQILVERLAYARSMRKKESENKKVLQQDFLKKKEEEINERLVKK